MTAGPLSLGSDFGSAEELERISELLAVRTGECAGDGAGLAPLEERGGQGRGSKKGDGVLHGDGLHNQNKTWSTDGRKPIPRTHWTLIQIRVGVPHYSFPRADGKISILYERE